MPCKPVINCRWIRNNLEDSDRGSGVRLVQVLGVLSDRLAPHLEGLDHFSGDHSLFHSLCIPIILIRVLLMTLIAHIISIKMNNLLFY